MSRFALRLCLLTVTTVSMLTVSSVFAQDSDAPLVDPAPDRTRGEGPFERLVIRGGYLIDGTGAPPQGPVDIVIENNRIAEVRVVGSHLVPIDPAGRPDAGDREIDAGGMYILPGFINAHAHVSNPGQAKFGKAAPAEYAYKLWMGHASPPPALLVPVPGANGACGKKPAVQQMSSLPPGYFII